MLRGLDGELACLGLIELPSFEWRPSTSLLPLFWKCIVPETLRPRGDLGERIVFSAVWEILLLRKLSEKLELLLVSLSEGNA
jgi:hypothetical protein